MDPLKDIRWRQRFENFEKSYNLLNKYANHELETELEQAGIIQFFEMTFELAWKVMKDYLESQGYLVKSPREAIKQAFQIGLIDDGHIWIDALSNRNLTAHTYNQALVKKFLVEIKQLYLPAFQQLYERLKEE
jgi:nucleotidyltransferase substrate binding protein (TIGR01987 family)